MIQLPHPGVPGCRLKGRSTLVRLIPYMVAQRYDVHPVFHELSGKPRYNAFTTCGIFAVYHYSVHAVFCPQLRNGAVQCTAPGFAHYVSQKQDDHQ